MESEKVHLTKEKATLLWTLYCRALDSRSKNSILHDQGAEKIVGSLDYDFRKIRVQGDDILSAATRAKQLDQWTRDFLADHSEATVLHLACGLDGRVDRVTIPPNVCWYDLDYPEVIELRQRFYSQRTGYSMIGASVTDPGFLDQVQTSGPVMIVAEGLSMYLSEEEVKELLCQLTDRFPNGQLAFDVWSRSTLKIAKFAPVIATLGAKIGWGIDDLGTIEEWIPRLQLVREVTWTEAIVREGAKIPLGFRIAFGLVNWIPSMRSMMRFLLYQF